MKDGVQYWSEIEYDGMDDDLTLEQNAHEADKTTVETEISDYEDMLSIVNKFVELINKLSEQRTILKKSEDELDAISKIILDKQNANPPQEVTQDEFKRARIASQAVRSNDKITEKLETQLENLIEKQNEENPELLDNLESEFGVNFSNDQSILEKSILDSVVKIQAKIKELNSNVETIQTTIDQNTDSNKIKMSDAALKEDIIYLVKRELNPNWPFSSLYIDTIDYNQWEKELEKLKILRHKYAQLPDAVPPSDIKEPKKEDGEEYEPVCDKYFPLNYAKVLGIGDLITIPFMNVVELCTYENGEPILEPVADIEDWDGTAVEEGEIVTDDETGEEIEYPPIYFNQKKEKRNVAIKDGYAYVCTGVTITVEYTGIPIGKKPLLIPGVGFDYGTALGGYYMAKAQSEQEKIKKYPYLNHIPSGEFFWLQSSLVTPSDIANLANQFKPDYKPLLVDFDVYQKFKLDCGFPKKTGELTCEEIAINGKCGLQQFLSNPITINRNGVDPKKYKKSDLNMQAKLKVSDWKKDLNDSLKNSWDFAGNLAKNTWNKTMTMENFNNIANQMFPAMDFLPKECMKTICEAQRKAAGSNSIKDMNSSLKNGVDAAKLLVADVGKSVKDAAMNIADGIGDYAKASVTAAKEMLKTFNVYQLCPRRFNDWLMDAGEQMGVKLPTIPGVPGIPNTLALPIPIDPFTQLQNIFSAQIMNSFKGLLNNCVTKQLGTIAINDVKNIAKWQTNQALGAFRAGNFTELGKTIKGTKLADKFMDSATNTLNFAGTMKTPTFNINKLTSLGNDMTRRLKAFTKIKNSSDIFNTLANIRNAQYETQGFISILEKELKDLGV